MPSKGFLAEIYLVLCGSNMPLTAQQIADIINDRGWYTKSSGRDITATDVRNRLRNIDPIIIGVLGYLPKCYYIPK